MSPPEGNPMRADEPSDLAESSAVKELALRVKWGRDVYAVELPCTSTIGELKRRLFELTEVLPKRQKVLGLPKVEGKPPRDEVQLKALNVPMDHRVMLVGSRETDIQKLAQEAAKIDAGAVVDDLDLDLDYSLEDERRILRYKEQTRRKLERRLESTNIRILNEPRDGKKLLVLDLDYTLFDCKGIASNVAELSRPGLHEFLKAAYEHYDIVIWSQTSWRWLEAKITELGMLLNPEYRICFVMDKTSMFSVTTHIRNEERCHEVKALEILWRKFPNRWDAQNTIHVDDLSRNFALNPQSGLKIAPFKNAHISRATDRELYDLAMYLRLIAVNENDFRQLDHKRWKFYTRRRSEVLRDER